MLLALLVKVAHYASFNARYARYAQFNATLYGVKKSCYHPNSNTIKGEVKAKIKISPVVVFGVLSRMVLVRGS